jgi:hypothetical protein
MSLLISDEELLEKFEDGSLPPAEFHHEQHVRLAFLYLRKYPLLGVLTRFPADLKRYAAMHGKNGLYHETITWAYLFIIGERVARAAEKQTWEEFRVANLDLFDREAPLLRRYYRNETLASALARERFVMPDYCRERTPR